MEHFSVEKVEDLIEKLRALSFEELLEVESQLRLKGHTYLTRIDNEVLVEDFQPHKRPYIIGRTQSEGEYLLSSKMPFLKGKALSGHIWTCHIRSNQCTTKFVVYFCEN